MAITNLKLHHYPASRSARVKWLLHELFDDRFETASVDLYGGEQYQPDYLAKNPNHHVPLLEVTFDSGETLNMIESGAMIAWLADAVPEKGLAPPNDLSRERADYLQMLHFGATWADMMLWQVRVHEHVLPAGQRDERTIARYRNKFEAEAEPQLKARLERAPYICGDAFTAADCVIGHDVMWARGYGLCQDSPFRSYLSAISKRPAFLAAFADAGQFKPEPPANASIVRRFTG